MKILKVMTPLLLMFLAGCGGGGSDGSASNAGTDLPALNDIATASTVVQKAAKAVVLVRTAGAAASGSFISGTGLFLTNNHVLGDTVCPREGCYVQITFLRQRGQQRQQPTIVFAVPQSVDVGLDMAVVQMYDSPGGNKLTTPDYLSFNAQPPAALIGTHVTIIGHPDGRLKKWSDGVIFDTAGNWIKSTNYSLPGNSGSPAIDDNGQIVGLIHRGPTAQDLFTSNGANLYSIGTASAPLVTAMTVPLPAVMISTSAATTTDQFLARDYVYLNAHATSVQVDGVTANPLTLLGQACDAALARQDFLSPDDLTNALTPCFHAQTWIDCRVNASPVPYGVVCPANSDSLAWAGRFQKMNQLQTAMNGALDYYSVSFAMSRLQSTTGAGYSAGAQSLLQAMSGSGAVLDFTGAYYLAAFNVGSYNGANIKNYVTNYQQVSNYGQQAYNIALAGDLLYYFGSLQKSDLLPFLTQLYGNRNTSTGTKLLIEDIQYGLDSL